MLRWLKALPLTLAIAALSLVATSCSTTSTQARFVNAIQDTDDYGGQNAALDVDVNNTKVFTDYTFATAVSSSYKGIPSGSVTVEGFEYNTTTEVFDNTNVGLNSGTQYTLVATGFATGTNGANVVLLTPTDNNTEPANGSVSFRVINASPSGPTSVDVWIEPAPFTAGQLSGTAQIPNVSYRSATNYYTTSFNSNGGGFLLFVTASGNTSELYINGQSIPQFGGASEGAIRTIVLTDVANGSTMNSLAVVLNDLN